MLNFIHPLTLLGLCCWKDDSIHQQIEYLNEAFSPAGFSFFLAETTRWLDGRFSTLTADVGKKLSDHTRKGLYTALNIFIMEELDNPGVAGACVFFGCLCLNLTLSTALRLPYECDSLRAPFSL